MVAVVLPIGEVAVALGELHEGRRLGLDGRGALAHLLARGHDAPRARAGDGQEHGDAEPAGVDAPGLGQDVARPPASSSARTRATVSSGPTALSWSLVYPLGQEESSIMVRTPSCAGAMRMMSQR